jgi:type III restriction enzyme
VNRKLELARVIDLSATPFFLRGSGYAEGTLFPWTMSDFSLMDAIECDIVKLPRVPVAENIPVGADLRAPCFIVVCNNTSTSKLVYDYISGFHRQNDDGSSTLENGPLALFRNFDEHGNPYARPNTLPVRSR